jgi:hypothetical protein
VPIIQTPDGPVNFPDSMKDADIESVLQKQYAPKVAGAGPLGVPSPVAHPAVSMGTSSLAGPALTLGDLSKGIVKGGLNTINGVSSLIHSIPGGIGETLVPQSGLTGAKMYAEPHGTAQKIGKGTEQAAEFMLPGLGEEGAGLKLAEFAPTLGRMAAPIARIGVQSLGSGLINKEQGGTFATGAAAGMAGAGIGEGLKAAAPSLTGLAQGVGRKTGKAILDETSGIFPNAVRKSAQAVSNNIGEQIGDVMENASRRPVSPIRGLLQAPEYDVPLHSSDGVAGTPSRPLTLNQVDRPMLRGLPTPSGDVPMAPGLQDIFPERMASGTSSARLDFPHNVRVPPVESTPGLSQAEYIGEVPGERGGPGQTQGVLRTRGPISTNDEFGNPKSIPFPGEEPPASEVPYRGISLTPFRDQAQSAIDSANMRGNVKLAKGIGKVQDNTLLNRGLGGPRPDVVSPSEFWQTKRGVGEAVSATKWRPGYNDPFTGVQKGIYGNMADTLHKAVPESIPLDSRYSALIDATRPAPRSIFGHAAGPAAGALLGGTEGYRENGLLGSIKGAVLGGIAGIAAPTALNAGARMAWNPLAQKFVPMAVGGALQYDRSK